MKREKGTGSLNGAWAARATAGCSSTLDNSPCVVRAFSLLELLVVMSVTLMLTGLMLPALARVHEESHRVVCSSNLRQVGLAVVMYHDFKGKLPGSSLVLEDGLKSEMMAAHLGDGPGNWEGLGWLYADLGDGRFVSSPEVFYCPSHHGEHRFDRYQELWAHPGGTRIYTNYHYVGPIDWLRGMKRRIDAGESIVLATDGLRTPRDFNHRVGINVLRSDVSVGWRDDIAEEVLNILAASGEVHDDNVAYGRIWNLIDNN